MVILYLYLINTINFSNFIDSPLRYKVQKFTMRFGICAKV